MSTVPPVLGGDADGALQLPQLSVLRPLWPVNPETGMVDIPEGHTSFSLDVGFNFGKISAEWLQDVPGMFVVGVEASRELYSYYDAFCNSIASNSVILSARNSKLRFFFGVWKNASKHCNKRMFLINAAAGSRYGATGFAPDSSGMMDDGSLVFGGKDAYKEPVISLPLATLLATIPHTPDFVWDTIKVDIQGVDADAVVSTGHFIQNFKCVVAEFAGKPTCVPCKEHGMYSNVDAYKFLKQQGFLNILDLNRFNMSDNYYFSLMTKSESRMDHRMWLNSKYIDDFKNGNYHCKVADVTTARGFTRRMLLRRIEMYEKFHA